MKLYITIILSLLSCVCLYAQDSLKTTMLDSITVSAQKVNLLEKTPSGDILQKKDLQTLNTNTVGDAAKFLSGVMVKDYGGLGGVKTISVRGLSSNHTAILYDGVNIFDNQSGQVDLGKYSLSSVGSLSLANGQFTPMLPTATALASSSSISIQTEKPNLNDKRQRGEFSLSYGSFSTVNADWFYAQKINNKNIITTYFDIISSKGDYPFVLHYGTLNNQKTEELKRENNDILSTHAEINWFLDINRTNTLKVKAYAYYSDRGLPSDVTLYYMNSKDRLYNKNLFLQSSYTSYLSGLFTYKNNFKIDWNFTEYIEPLLSNGLGGEDDVYKQTLIYDNNALSFQPRENMFFTLTNDLYYNTLKAVPQMDDTPGRFSSLTAFVIDWRIEKHIYVTANLLHSYYLDEYLGETTSTNHFSPFISVKYQRGIFTSTLFYKNIFRMPTFNELYYRRVGSRSLKPENTLQLSFTNTLNKDYNSWGYSTELSLYYNDVTDKIVAIPKNIYLWSMVNYGKAEIYGADVRLGLWLKMRDITFDIKLNYSYSHAMDNEKESITYKNLLPYSPEQVYTIISTLRWNKFTLGYNCMLVDNRYSLPENSLFNLLPHYADHSANLSYVLNKNGDYTFTFAVNNILNKQYEVIRSYPMMGRNFQFKITLKL
ncbi:MAG: TonB-dependent receptor plug domain-containing protein [Bacteroidales bacterium]|nr:TonB-dependent receptor plug domain-containing protein [Bacteroidales bacterium]